MNREVRQFELLKKMAFVRTGGSAEELKAANIIREELNKLGVESKLEPFKVMQYTVHKVKLEILEPFNKEIIVEGIGFTGNTPEEGLTAELEYVEQAEPINLINAKDKIVIVNSGLTVEKYRNIIKAGAIGFITFSGKFNDDKEKTDLDLKAIRKHHLEFGKIPGVTMRVKDAIDMVKNEATKVRMTLIQNEGEVDSHNVIAEIKGTCYPEEVIVFMAHYDSVPFSTGAYDNGAGSVNIMEILHHYLENAPKRTLKFIWFGSEEVGLLGSKAYVEAHVDELESIKFGINIDLGGTILGEDKANIMAEESLCNMLEFYSKEVSFPLTIKQSIYSSDSIPFSDKGIPTVNFLRIGAPGAVEIHNRYDILETLSPKPLYNTMKFIQDFSEKIINSHILPIPRKIPENIVKDIDKYLRKEESKEQK